VSGPRVVVVAKRTPYQHYVEDERDPRVQALFKRRDPAVRTWQRAHKEHARTLETVLSVLERENAKIMLLRGAQAVFDPADAQIVVVVGGDGTMLAASHSVGGVPVLGVNSAPGHSVGFFCAAQRGTFKTMLCQALDGKLGGVTLTRMSVQVNGRLRSRRILNEALFCHSEPAATSRYTLKFGRRNEEQRSSGFWIGPAAGSTGALCSAGGRILPLSSRKLQLVVREPMFGRPLALGKVLVGEHQSISAHSMMDSAALYLDGPYRELPVQIGDEVVFRASDEPLKVLGLKARKKS
jgi:NAD+ kinase